MIYGGGSDESVVTQYLDSHLENGIKQKNLDLILDLIDEYLEVKELAENKLLKIQSNRICHYCKHALCWYENDPCKSCVNHRSFIGKKVIGVIE